MPVGHGRCMDLHGFRARAARWNVWSTVSAGIPSRYTHHTRSVVPSSTWSTISAALHGFPDPGSERRGTGT
jgi:hypothetical protein